MSAKQAIIQERQTEHQILIAADRWCRRFYKLDNPITREPLWVQGAARECVGKQR